MMITKVYIVVKNSHVGPINHLEFIESVWTTEELAKSAILYHAFRANISSDWYEIIERKLNEATKNDY